MIQSSIFQYSIFNLLALHRLCLISTTVFPLDQCAQLALDELLAERRYVVYEHLSVEMVELMLHHSGKIALDPLVMVVEVLIVPFHMDARGSDHLLMDGRQREASFFRAVGLALIVLNDMRIDEHLSEAFVFGQVV